MIMKKLLSEMPRISWVYSDLSGTLSDDRYPVWMANKRLAEEFSIEYPSFEEWLRNISSTFAGSLKKYGIHGDPKALFKRYADHYGRIAEEGILPKIYPGAEDLMKYLKGRGKNIVIVSSHPEEHVAREARRYGIDKYTEGIFGSVHDKSKGLIMVSELMKSDPAESAYIGDTEYDVKSAKDAGMLSVAITHGYRSREALLATDFDVMVDSLFELRNGLFR